MKYINIVRFNETTKEFYRHVKNASNKWANIKGRYTKNMQIIVK